jgi:hypothetical protein
VLHPLTEGNAIKHEAAQYRLELDVDDGTRLTLQEAEALLG